MEKDNYIYYSEIRNIVLNKEKEKMDKLLIWKNNYICIYIELFLMYFLNGYFIVYVIEFICNNILIFLLKILRFKL